MPRRKRRDELRDAKERADFLLGTMEQRIQERSNELDNANQKISWLNSSVQRWIDCAKFDQDNSDRDQEKGQGVKRVADSNVDDRPQKQARIEDQTSPSSST